MWQSTKLRGNQSDQDENVVDNQLGSTFYNAKQLPIILKQGEPRADYWYPFILSDLVSNIGALPQSIGVYFSSVLMKILFPLMVLSHGFLIVSMWNAVAENPRFFGSGATPTVITVLSVVFFMISISPLLTTFDYSGPWKVVGGKPRLIERWVIFLAVIPVLFMASLLFPPAEPLGKLILAAVTLLFAILPLIVRSVGAKNIKDSIEIWIVMSQSRYVDGLLAKKVIGTPGASLGTSSFSASQVSAGVVGEKRTAKLLDTFAKENRNVIVFHSVRWNMDGAPYDIDHVVVIGSTVYFLDSKNWGNGQYRMLSGGETVLKDGASIPNGELHIQTGADTYIDQFGISEYVTQVVVWTDGTLSNDSAHGTRLVTGSEMLDWLRHTADEAQGAGSSDFNAELLRRLEEKTS